MAAKTDEIALLKKEQAAIKTQLAAFEKAAAGSAAEDEGAGEGGGGKRKRHRHSVQDSHALMTRLEGVWG